MPNPLSKGWKYLTASLDRAIDENADPKVQLQQAADEAKRQHKSIVDHAAALLGDRRQWELKLHRLQEQQQKLEQQARAAINAGDNEVAEAYATQLVTVEQQLEDAKTMHGQAVSAAEKAQQMAKESELRLRDQMAQLDQLRAQADQAAMQQASVKAMGSMDEVLGRDPDANVPTLDSVREKIERRYATALGAQELAESSSATSRMEEIMSGASDMRASARLEEIRAQLATETTGELEAGKGERVVDDAEIEEDGGGQEAPEPDEAEVSEEMEEVADSEEAPEQPNPTPVYTEVKRDLGADVHAPLDEKPGSER
ncbi:PspA/IM30 family protein [Corynebacterium canis]|uniref:PspA/IM30 family protein n=1 Tax=Corynebacterium canis TaxID=679663 RepID=A0A5C5UAB2_9CORY|nr:PspA/IM30 family protein [Corynebacterium canis]TWT22899.1 PspA/IM30 family protein [Corynebacterium canis]WJY76488.1 PspA/IM30 family protein [Corynebacterium canis]